MGDASSPNFPSAGATYQPFSLTITVAKLHSSSEEGRLRVQSVMNRLMIGIHFTKSPYRSQICWKLIQSQRQRRGSPQVHIYLDSTNCDPLPIDIPPFEEKQDQITSC